MAGRTMVITGASDGIGAAAARALAERGERVVLVGRSPRKTRAVAAELGVEHHVADFARLAEVRTLAEVLGSAHPRIDVLANNAGGIMGARELTEDGFERTLQVNHLAPFLLTRLLMDPLLAGGGSVVNTSSVAARALGRLDLDDLGNARRYSPNKAYGDSKLANILFTVELHRRFHHRGLAAAAFHPGAVATNFAADSTSAMRLVFRTPLRHLLLTAPEQGADTLVWLATGTPGQDWVSGLYYERRRPAGTHPQAGDHRLAEGLWVRSSEMVGLDPA